MKKQFLKSRPVCKVTFSLPQEAAPSATSVQLLGDFNEWKPEEAIEMKLNLKEKAFQTELELPTGQNYAFRYLIDHSSWENAWDADAYVPSPFEGIENSILHLPAPEIGPSISEKKAPAKADDLKKIEGIGPKIADLLVAQGIDTYQKLAEVSPDRLRGILAEAGPRYKGHAPDTWPQQAKMAQEGEWKTLEAWQGELKGGKGKKAK
ncbi:MAG: DUF4332 domain-containing protein [Microscillaceae bacterium]|nr:DUF4332 domain-containing protein [Microscillaceae bacterium]